MHTIDWCEQLIVSEHERHLQIYYSACFLRCANQREERVPEERWRKTKLFTTIFHHSRRNLFDWLVQEINGNF